MINVDVISESNLWSKKIRKKDIFFNTLVRYFPKQYRFIKKKISLTILLSNNKNIKRLNRKFKNNNKPTDILSFPSERKFNIKKSQYLGDIVISYEFMNKPKTLKNIEFRDKVTRIFIHGFLHLLGYDHIRLKDFKKMIKEEEKIYKATKTKIAKFV
tara:strand:+ start:609 stop:1079 length:471 start_codon:yes stop_codon:yes gene_type:complete